MTTDPSRVRVRGPLQGFTVRFDVWLAGQGYRDLTRVRQLQRLGRLSGWLAARELRPADMTLTTVGEFVDHDNQERRSRVQPAAPLIEFLADEGVIDGDGSCCSAGVGWRGLLEVYHQMLVSERGLSVESVKVYDRTAAMFLEAIGGADSIPALDAAAVTSFLLSATASKSTAWSKTMVFGLRSLLRFLFAEGLIVRRLDLAVPSVAGWRQTALPRGVTPAVVRRLLSGCDRRRGEGRRDYAVILLLWRLGVRAVEVSALDLDDVDWRNGEIMIHGKGGRHDRLPLPTDVGEAIAGYLRRRRPRICSRALLLTTSAPIRRLSPGGVRSVVRRAAVRSGVTPFGSHRLRHGMATELLRQGSSLLEIAQVLRHQRIDTTAMYAKVDDRALILVARPWPGRLA
jgi:site-specific recombinase XerD